MLWQIRLCVLLLQDVTSDGRAASSVAVVAQKAQQVQKEIDNVLRTNKERMSCCLAGCVLNSSPGAAAEKVALLAHMTGLCSSDTFSANASAPGTARQRP